MHSYIHTYVRPYIHTIIHSYIHTIIQSYVLPSIPPYVHTLHALYIFIHYIHTYTHSNRSNAFAAWLDWAQARAEKRTQFLKAEARMSEDRARTTLAARLLCLCARNYWVSLNMQVGIAVEEAGMQECCGALLQVCGGGGGGRGGANA